MKRIFYRDAQNDPKYAEAVDVINSWRVGSAEDKKNFDIRARYLDFFPDVEILKKVGADNTFKTSEQRMRFLSNFFYIDNLEYEDIVAMMPQHYYKFSFYGRNDVLEDILSYLDLNEHFKIKPHSVLNNISSKLSQNILNGNKVNTDHIYHLINFIKNGSDGQTFAEFKEGRDDLMVEKDGVVSTKVSSLETLYELNEVNGFNYVDYSINAETDLAKAAAVLNDGALGSVSDTTPKGYIKVLDDLDLKTWKKLIQLSYDKKIKGIRTIKALKLFLEDLKKGKKTGEEMQNDMTEAVLETLLEKKANYNSSATVFQMIPSEYELNKVVDVDGVVNLTNYITDEKLSTMETALILTAISNKSIWIRNSNPSNVYSLLFELVKLDRKGSLEFLEFLIRENNDQVPTAKEIEEFIANYDDEFSLGILGSLSLSLISKSSTERYIGQKIDFLREQFDNLEEYLD